MKIINWEIAEKFARKHPLSRNPLNSWQLTVIEASWQSVTDVRSTFNSMDYTRKGNFLFHLRTHTFRFVARINFAAQTVWLIQVLTHAEYDKMDL